jgi:hypothetical protein
MATRLNWTPIILVLCGAMAIGFVGAMFWRELGYWELLLAGGLAVAVSAVFWFRRKLTATEIDVAQLRERLRQEEQQIEADRRQLEATRQQVSRELELQSTRIEKREQALAQRFLTYHEWMEFPKPIDVSQPESPSDLELAELVRKDRQMQKLLKDETQQLYDNILANRYIVNENFDPEILFHDARELMTKVARIYEPNSEHPLLETSLPRIIRGVSRACLQMLVVIDELPLDVKKYSINRMANYIRRAVQAYRMYRSSEPYWPYVNTAWYLSRFAMGTNPLTLGAWWFIGSLSQRGATALAQHLVNRQALALLANVVRVIGYEVASLYGDFRHRDANWIYAVELTELVSHFPLSRDSLSHALREIGALQLRSEYDRVYLYRCLAAQASSRPEQYRATVVLTPEERNAIAGRLERFLTTFIHGKTPERVTKWKSGVEERLNVKVAAWTPSAKSSAEQRHEALRSLASFLVSVKEREVEELPALLSDNPLLAELSPDEQQTLFRSLQDSPPYFFEHPDLESNGEFASRYLDELVRLHVHHAPREPQIEAFLNDAAAYLRKDEKYVGGLLDKHFNFALSQRLTDSNGIRKAPRTVARAVLDMLGEDEQAKFLYSGVSLEWPTTLTHPPVMAGRLWLLGVDDRLLLFTPDPEPKLLWRGEVSQVRPEVVRGYVTAHCELKGGHWVADRGLPAPGLHVGAPLVGSATAHFRPLLELLEANQSATPKISQS